jgi:hypothetical protein
MRTPLSTPLFISYNINRKSKNSAKGGAKMAMKSARRITVIAVMLTLLAVVAVFTIGNSEIGVGSSVNVHAAAKSGFVKSKGVTKYYKKGKAVKGWQTIKSGGKKYKYYFGAGGKMKTKWQTISKKKYYFGANGRMRTKWQTISAKKYYFGADGKMRTGQQTISGEKYYFGADGKMRTGQQTISGKQYYFGTDGKMKTGYQTISGKQYYFDANGANKPIYTVTVSGGMVNGARSVSYIAGTKVAIKANAAPAGKVFNKWSTGQTTANFTYTIPAQNMTLTASYTAEIPTVYLNYKGEDNNKTAPVKITLGGAWSDTLKSSLGSVDKIVERSENSMLAYSYPQYTGPYTVYVYDTNAEGNLGDFSNYLEVFVRKGNVIGWLTNQESIAFWNGTEVKAGEPISKYEPLNKYWDDWLHNERRGLDEAAAEAATQPGITLYKRYNTENDGHWDYYPTDSGKVLWGRVTTGEFTCGYDYGDVLGRASIENEEVMAENYINAIRAAYGLNILKHNSAWYTAQGGPKETAKDWAAYGSINYNGKAHTTTGSIDSELKDLGPNERSNMVSSATGFFMSNENAGAKWNSYGSVEGWYLSTYHRYALLAYFKRIIQGKTYATSEICVGMASINSFASCMWIGD